MLPLVHSLKQHIYICPTQVKILEVHLFEGSCKNPHRRAVDDEHGDCGDSTHPLSQTGSDTVVLHASSIGDAEAEVYRRNSHLCVGLGNVRL